MLQVISDRAHQHQQVKAHSIAVPHCKGAGDVITCWCPTDWMLADMFTKSLITAKKFEELDMHIRGHAVHAVISNVIAPRLKLLASGTQN